jgi:hypothetical protein
MEAHEMSESNSASSRGIGFFGLLTIVFIILKLTGYISWSWMWVLAPIWMPIALVVVIFGIVMLVVVLRSR